MALNGGTPVRHRPFPRWPEHDDTERALLLQVLESGVWAYEGPMEQAFSERFAKACGAAHAVCVSNGTVSLEMCLRGLGVGPGDEVIVPALTWTAPAWAAVQAGADVVFADVGADWCLAPSSIEERVTPRAKALVVVHTYCQLAEMDEILAIARRHDLAVVEDCAHAHGSRWRGRGAGTLGDVGSYSFQLSKSMTAGEGGVVVTNDKLLAEQLYALKNCGRRQHGTAPFGFGGNHRMTEFQAAVLLAQLQRLDMQVARRAVNVGHFRSMAARLPGLTPLPPKPHVTRQGVYALALDYEPSLFQDLPVDLLIASLNAEGIPARRPYEVVYRSPLWLSGMTSRRWQRSEQPARRLGLDASCPTAERIAGGRGIVLPHQLFLGTENDVDDVLEAIDKVRCHASELRHHA